MKTAVIFCDGTKQIIFTPENDSEKFALGMLTANDDIELLLKSGGFGDEYNEPFTATVNHCQSGFLRLYGEEYSRILVLRPKQKES